jgi:hypothetical protein
MKDERKEGMNLPGRVGDDRKTVTAGHAGDSDIVFPEPPVQ